MFAESRTERPRKLNIIAIDDERPALRMLEKSVSKFLPQAVFACFTSPVKALEYIKQNVVDIAFLDMEIGGISGLEMAKKIKKIQSNIKIVFVTGYSHALSRHFGMQPKGYLLKPINPVRVEEEIKNIQNLVLPRPVGLYAKCFGSFDVLINGEKIEFKADEEKEILAYLIYANGKNVYAAEIAAALSQSSGRVFSNRDIAAFIKKTDDLLKQLGVESLILKEKKLWDFFTGKTAFCINTTKIKCDYYDFLRGDINAVNAYGGEFMTGYGWGEF